MTSKATSAMNLKERIAALEKRNADPKDSSIHRSVSPTNSVTSGSPPTSALRAKIANFERKGGVPVPRGSFGLGAPPAGNGQQRRRGELYGNRIPTPLRSGLITPTLTGNTLLNGIPSHATGRSISPMPTGTFGRTPTLGIGEYSEADVVEVGGFDDASSPTRIALPSPPVDSPVRAHVVELAVERGGDATDQNSLWKDTSTHGVSSSSDHGSISPLSSSPLRSPPFTSSTADAAESNASSEESSSSAVDIGQDLSNPGLTPLQPSSAATNSTSSLSADWNDYQELLQACDSDRPLELNHAAEKDSSAEEPALLLDSLVIDIDSYANEDTLGPLSKSLAVVGATPSDSPINTTDASTDQASGPPSDSPVLAKATPLGFSSVTIDSCVDDDTSNPPMDSPLVGEAMPFDSTIPIMFSLDEGNPLDSPVASEISPQSVRPAWRLDEGDPESTQEATFSSLGSPGDTTVQSARPSALTLTDPIGIEPLSVLDVFIPSPSFSAGVVEAPSDNCHTAAEVEIETPKVFEASPMTPISAPTRSSSIINDNQETVQDAVKGVGDPPEHESILSAVPAVAEFDPQHNNTPPGADTPSNDSVSLNNKPLSISVFSPEDFFLPQTPQRMVSDISLPYSEISTPGTPLGLAYDETPRPSPSASPRPSIPGTLSPTSTRSSVHSSYPLGTPSSARPQSMIELSPSKISTAQRISPSPAVALFIPGSESLPSSAVQDEDQSAMPMTYTMHRASRSHSAISQALLPESPFLEPEIVISDLAQPISFSATVHRKVTENISTRPRLHSRAATETPRKRVRDSFGKEPWTPGKATELTKLVADSALLEQFLLGGQMPGEVEKPPLRGSAPPSTIELSTTPSESLKPSENHSQPEPRRPIHVPNGDALLRSKSELHLEKGSFRAVSPANDSRHNRFLPSTSTGHPLPPQLKAASNLVVTSNLDEADIPPTPPPKSPAKYINGLRRLTNAPPKRMPGAFPHDSGSMSSELSSEDSVMLATPPENNFDFTRMDRAGNAPIRRTKPQMVSDFGDLRVGGKPHSERGSQPSVSRKLSNLGHAASKMWQRARTKSGGSSISNSGSDSSQPLPHPSDPMPPSAMQFDRGHLHPQGRVANMEKTLPPDSQRVERPTSCVSVESASSQRTTDIFDAFPSVPAQSVSPFIVHSVPTHPAVSTESFDSTHPTHPSSNKAAPSVGRKMPKRRDFSGNNRPTPVPF